MTDSFRALIERSPDGVAVIRFGRYVYANSAWARLLGRPLDQINARSLLDDVDPAERERLRQRLEAPNAEAQLGEFLFRSGEDRRLNLQLRLVPIESFEGAACVALMARDVTDHRRVQANLLLADRLMSVGALAAGVAHEINNPLSYVMGNLAFLSEELDRLAEQFQSPLRTDLLEAVQEAQEGAERVRSIVRNLQAFARADQEGTDPIDVNRTIEAAVGMAWIELRHRARLTKELGEGLPPVLTSEARLGQVVLNLLLNAAHALPEGEADKNTICVATSHDEESGEVRMEISDTGPGIPPEIVERVFDPFLTTKPVGIGTGLGLSIVHSIVTAMGGTIEVDSQLGAGTTFTVRMPTAWLSNPSESRPVVEVFPAGLRGRVLIVDDEPLIANSLRRALKNHEVTVVRSGRKAIETIEKRGDFDVIFCDLMMPELTGMDVHAWMREHRPGMEDRMVFMSGGVFTRRAQDFLQTVDNHRVAKPFDLDRIRAYVDKRIAGGTIQTADIP